MCALAVIKPIGQVIKRAARLTLPPSLQCRREVRRGLCHLWMPPDCKAFLRIWGGTLACSHLSGLLARSLTAGLGGIRGSAPPSRHRACRSDKASGLADPGRPVSPSDHHHPRNPVGGCPWLKRQRRSCSRTSRRGSAWPRRHARSCWPWRAGPRLSADVRADR